MRRRTKVALIAVGTSAVVAGAAFVRGRFEGRGTEKALPDEDAVFTAFAPGGPQALWSIGPVRWLTSRIMPIAEAGVYRTVADMLDLRPDDTLLDIGCGPGGFAAAKAQHVGRVVGLETSPLMLRAAERRLADRIAAGTAELVLGNAAQLPFGDSTFSAATAIYAPASAAEGVPGAAPRRSVRGRRPDPRTPKDNAPSSYGRRRWGEADYRSMFEDAGFSDLMIRLGRGGLFARCRKPTAPNPSTAFDPNSQQEPSGSAEIV